MELERLFRLVRKHQDPLLAAALATMSQVEIWSSGNALEDKLLIAPLALAGTVSLLWRRREPVVVLLLITGVWYVSTLVVPTSGDDSLAGGIALVIAIYSVGAHAHGGWAVAGVFAALGVTFAATATDPDEASLGSYAFFLFVVGGSWLAGRAIRHRRQSERLLEERAVAAEREREARARAAVAEERTRIARELHDVVAHAISMIVVQARGGRRSLATEPAEARAAFDSIEEAGAQALTEMRRLLGMLRNDDEQLALAPQPALRNLDTLVAQLREAGLSVEFSIEGEPTELPTGIDLSAYRIVQEALTNALRHAGPATARVIIRYRRDGLELEIVDTGSGADDGDVAGRGLLGMRERAALYGGEVEAGQRRGGGFAVRARLPLDSARP